MKNRENRTNNGKSADVIIFGGQSNMQGQSERLSEYETVPGAYEYLFLDDCLRPLRNPVGENVCFDGSRGWPLIDDADIPAWLKTHGLGSACYGHTNLVPEFCRAYIAETARSVIAVHAARGSTIIKEWLPGSVYYGLLRDKILGALNRAKAEEISIGRIYFVWLQGESDAIEGRSREEYASLLKLLGSTLKGEFSVERFGIIRVGRFTNDRRDGEIMAAQDELCETCADDFLMLTKIAADLYDQPQYMHPDIGGHFSAAGLELLGKEAGTALGRFAAGINCQ